MGKNARKRRLERMKIRGKPQQQSQKQNVAVVPSPTASPAPNMQYAAETSDIVKHIKGKKVISFLQDNFDCCGEKCILEYMEEFNKDNYACLIVPKRNYTDILKYLTNYVVLFRLGWKDVSIEQTKNILGYISHLKQMGIRVVYYADDLIFWANNNAPLVYVKASDAVIVSNETLKEVLIKQGQVTRPIYVVPTHVYLKTYDKLPTNPPFPLSQKFKILMTSQGRIGVTGLYDICAIANEDPELAGSTQWVINSHGVAQIRSIINKFRNLDKVYIDWVPLGLYYMMTKAVDVIIHPASTRDLEYLVAPEMQQAWLDSKSEVKYTLAGAARIPIISSPIASYKAAIRDGETGFIADTAQEFIDKIRELKRNPDLCRKVGMAARKDIEERYNLPLRYPQYRDAIVGASKEKEPSMIISPIAQMNKVFIPALGEGGPGSFYSNMKKYIPIVSEGKWSVTPWIDDAKTAIAIAFLADKAILDAKKARGLKYLHRIDGLPMDFNNNLEPKNLLAMQELLRSADKVVWQSNHCKNMWIEKGLVPTEVSTDGPIIHNGVDTTIFSPRPVPKEQEEIINVLHVNWSTFQHKRIDILFDIMLRAQESIPNMRFMLLGNYGDTNFLKNQERIAKYPNATYLGQIMDRKRDSLTKLANMYYDADFLLFTSEMEGSPNTVLEATACGTPIVYNSKADIVPEICGEQCLGFKSPMEFLEVYKGYVDIRPTLNERLTMQNCVKKYMECLDELTNNN